MGNAQKKRERMAKSEVSGRKITPLQRNQEKRWNEYVGNIYVYKT